MLACYRAGSPIPRYGFCWEVFADTYIAIYLTHLTLLDERMAGLQQHIQVYVCIQLHKLEQSITGLHSLPTILQTSPNNATTLLLRRLAHTEEACKKEQGPIPSYAYQQWVRTNPHGGLVCAPRPHPQCHKLEIHSCCETP